MKITWGRRFCAWCLCAVLIAGACSAAWAEEMPPDLNTSAGTAQAAAALPADVHVSAWAREEVRTAYDLGLVPAGLSLGSEYSANISREQFARLAVELVAVCRDVDVLTLMRQNGIVLAGDTAAQGGSGGEEERQETAEDTKEPGQDGAAAEQPLVMEVMQGTFSDTNDAYVELAARLGIVQGSGGAFRPKGTLTRAEAAAMLWRCMSILGRPDPNRAPDRFSDGYTIPLWAVDAVKYISGRTTAEGKPVMGGSGGMFQPQSHYSIEQAIVTILRCYNARTVEGTYPAWRDAPGYDIVEITLSFGGDCTFGRGKDAAYQGSFDEMYDKQGAAYFFSNVKEFHNDDLTMVNFEGALTTANTPREEKPYIFKGRAEYAKILQAGSVDVVTIANNHVRDYGNQGLKDTIANLTPYVAVSGYERQPVLTVKGVKVGFASNVGWSFDSAQKKFIDSAIANLRAQGAEVIIFNYHWGEEREYKSNKTQQAIAHYCIDSGADLVIGHHPHVVQEVETYKGKQIVYSLGNLSFGGNRNPTDKRCLIFRQTFSIDLNSQKIVGESHRAIPYKVSSVNNRNDYRPTPA